MGDLADDAVEWAMREYYEEREAFIEEKYAWTDRATHLLSTKNDKQVVEEVEKVLKRGTYDPKYLDNQLSMIAYYYVHGRLTEKQKWAMCLFATEYEL
ncbi:hypothetical protein Bcp1_162 [Bacillus phage Bcp1]|uniref:Uncharacterized protein n=1 Tax=Bacillus phage Bcp1 TaxID=584892 RepID=X2JMZ6_9CAUD|nr:hypothetical protein Bcp1_162 [Bacillus phage Bcp1]AHN66637.1 hypothetical protein Bcp1_162 [Bacillus phage Bcp1]AXQ67651.1 hypothetical protein KIOSHI_168 [Bacillus phage Kioshi]